MTLPGLQIEIKRYIQYNPTIFIGKKLNTYNIGVYIRYIKPLENITSDYVQNSIKDIDWAINKLMESKQIDGENLSAQTGYSPVLFGTMYKNLRVID